METKTVYVVGQYRVETSEGVVWDLQGIFDTEELAIQACKHDNYFYIPLPTNTEFPHESVEVPATYPYGQNDTRG